MSPAELLELVIQKRSELVRRKDRDYRRLLLHVGVARQLCKFLDDDQSRVSRVLVHRRGGRRRSSSTKRRFSEANLDSSEAEDHQAYHHEQGGDDSDEHMVRFTFELIANAQSNTRCTLLGPTEAWALGRQTWLLSIL